MSQVSWIGQTLGGRYRIEERLGQGGMSAVYKATDPNLRRVVAVKMIHSHLSSNPEFVRRFEEEAAAVAQLRHPNIIQVFDFNHDEDTYYMVMEFIPGETLQDRLKRLNAQDRRMTAVEAANYIGQVSEAVQYAHERGMVHRDIKPANIMLDVYGKAILMDFGIAKILGGQLHTATGAVVGTAMYMSPEQIVGEKVDERSDIYSLGVTLFEALSGRPPFEADSAMTLMMMHMNDPVPNLRELQPDLPVGLVQVAERALAKKRDLRFQTANEMAAALRQIRVKLEGDRLGPSPSAPLSADKTIVDQVPAVGKPGDDAYDLKTGPKTSDRSYDLQGGAVPFQKVQPTPPGKSDSPRQEVPGMTQGYSPAAGADRGGGARAGAVSPRLSGQPGTRKTGRSLNLPLIIGGGIGVLGLGALLLFGMFLLGRSLFFPVSQTPTQTPETASEVLLAVTQTAAAAAAQVTLEAPVAPTSTKTIAPTSTQTPYPTNTPAPTSTATPEGPYVQITNITIQAGVYVVEYETYGYTEQLPGMHVHFFFDTVSQENAGVPGTGPWILYGGPRPFTKYKVSDRPAYANQMCALVANPNHSIQPNTGNCFDLPND